MKTIDLGPPIPCDHLLGNVPAAAEFERIINPPARLVSQGRCVGVYASLPAWLAEKGHQITRQVKPKKNTRTQGLPTKSTILGSLPRVPLRHNYCRLSADTNEHPEIWELAKEFAGHICTLYEKWLPEEYERHTRQTNSEIVPDWVVPGTPFTTINFNVNHAIKHHRDAANQKGVWSNVIILRKNSKGGLLVLPEYRAALTQVDGAIIIFDGQKVMHGVTPIATQAGGYRCSVVLYALDQFRNCYPYAEELENIKRHRTKLEQEFRSQAAQEYGRSGKNANMKLNAKNKK